MHYAQFVTPQQYRMGFVGADQAPIYADCADCGEKEAVMHGMIKDDAGQIAIIRNPGEAFVHNALFCKSCFERRIAE